MNNKNSEKKTKKTRSIGSNWDSMKSFLTKKKETTSDLPVPQKKVKKTKAERLAEETALLSQSILTPDSRGKPGETPVIALDCEMVGTGKDDYSALARISIVNYYGYVLYDTLVKPPGKINDYRTKYSGIHPGDLDNAPIFAKVQKDIFPILKNKVVVGHAINNDFKAMLLDHPFKLIRDTAFYKPFLRKREGRRGRPQALRKLIETEFNLKIQEGEHDSITDARAALALYKKHRNEWEKYIVNHKQYEKEEQEEIRLQNEEIHNKPIDELDDDDDDDDDENNKDKEE